MQPTITWNKRPLEVAVEGASDKACEIIARKIATTAKRIAPKKSGKLSNSIEAKSLGKGKGYRVDAYGDRSAGKYYASFVELGSIHNPSPKPFLRPAAIKHRDELPLYFERFYGRYR